ncbi:sugar transferase [Patescibacteria group bacterium]|nr:sugar transferase [Patescibacteria group bacterium]
MNSLKKSILIISDLLMAFVSLWLALWIRYSLINQVDYNYWEHAWIFLPVFLLWLVVYFINDLYDYTRFSDNQQLVYSVLRSAIYNFLITVVFFYIIPKLLITPKTILVFLVCISSVLIMAGRYVFNRIFVHEKLLKRLLVIGNDKIHTQLAMTIKKNISYGYLFIGLVMTNPGRRTKFKTIGKIANLTKIIKKRRIDSIAIDVNSFRQNDEVFKIVSDACISRHIEVVDVNYLYENLTGKVMLENLSQIWFTNFNRSANKFSFFVKRFIDVVLSIIGLLFFIILSPILYLAVRLDSPGSFLFAQERIGANNKIFKIYKIRSMTMRACRDLKSKWNQTRDKRVTVAGRFLRMSGLDELPQCWNILKGEMSIVGPRPERPIYIEKLDKRQKLYYKRHLVKPGLTGWAQVMANYGGSFADADEKLQYDLYYIKNRSIFLDLVIILKTVRRLFESRGGY